MKNEFTIEDRWLGFEIHPETPPKGVLIASVFPQEEVERMFDHLRTLGAHVGVTFCDVTLLSNSRLPLEASQYARDHGVFDQFHEKMFRAYFNDGKDIGSTAVVLEVGKETGLDAGALGEALDQGTYTVQLQEQRKNAEKYAVSAVPTFVINGKEKLVGVKTIDEFRNILRDVQR